MRIGRDDWREVDPRDVAWVVEWQLREALPWVPVRPDETVTPEPGPEEDGRTWAVTVRVGPNRVRVRLPVRDLGRVITWCRSVGPDALSHPPALIRASLLAIREALRRDLASLNPLANMGYANARQPETGGQ